MFYLAEVRLGLPFGVFHLKYYVVWLMKTMLLDSLIKKLMLSATVKSNV